MRQQRTLLSSGNDTAKAINYLLNRWAAFTRFLDDGRVCLTNNAAERALRGVAVGRKNWTFAGSDAGSHRAAAVYTLIETCKMNEVDPQAWLADVLALHVPKREVLGRLGGGGSRGGLRLGAGAGSGGAAKEPGEGEPR